MFANRQEAGRLLSAKIARELPHYASIDSDQYVIGVSRGGILVAGPVCTRLKAPLSIFEAETIVDTERPSKEIAVVTASGLVTYNEHFRYLQGEQTFIGHQVKELAQRAQDTQRAWLIAAGLNPQPQLQGRRVIIIDEGMMISDLVREAAALTIRNRGAKEIVLVTPIICKASKEKLQGAYDRVLSLETPDKLAGTMRSPYQDSKRIADAEVIETLVRAAIYLPSYDVLEVQV